MPDTIAPPEPKLSFTQQMAAAAKTGVPSPAAQPAAAAPPAPSETKPATPPPTPPPDKPAPVAAPAATGQEPQSEAEWDAQFDEIATEKKSPTGKAFKKIKESRDGYRSKVAEFEKEIAKVPKHNAELIKKLETDRDDYKGRYEAFIVQFTPEFQAKFDGQIASVVASLKSAVPEAEAQKLADLLQIPDSDAKKRAIAEITDGMDQFQVAEIVAANREIRRINGERREAITKANQTLATISQECQKQSEESKTRLSKLFDETLASVAQGDKAIPVYQKREGDVEWNKGVDERYRVARAIFNGEQEPEDLAQSSLWAAAAPGILESFKTTVSAKDAEITELKATVAKLQGANPGLGTGSTSTTTGKPGGLMEKMLKVAQ